MEDIILVFLVSLALIGSNFIHKLFPKTPLPVVQISLGVLISLLDTSAHFQLDPELFLALIIAPLLYREGAEADATKVLKNWSLVGFLILPVVFVSTLILGYTTHSFMSWIPLAACFAAGAALGPTDAVAFSTLSKRFDFPARVRHAMKGEGLLNDASGLIAFQVSVTALTTGFFSLQSAGKDLFLSIVVGFAIGLGLALLTRFILSISRQVDEMDVTSSILADFTLPILAYFLAEEFHVSGIIAVVVAGVTQASQLKHITLYDAEVDRVTTNVWDAVNFVLNGLVFIFLGIELINIVAPIFENPLYDNLTLLLVVFIVTAILFLIRFVMLGIYFCYRAIKYRKSLRKYIKDWLLLTFSGVKGTVSLATIILLPSEVAEIYSPILFIVAGVTVLSFGVGVIIIPFLASPKKEQPDHTMQISILSDVVSELESDLKTTKHKGLLYAAIENYHGRIERLILDQESHETKRDLAILQAMIISIEGEGLETASKRGEVSLIAYRIYQRYVRLLEKNLNRGFLSGTAYTILVLIRVIHGFLRELVNLPKHLNRKEHLKLRLTDKDKESIAKLYLTNTSIILESLEELKGVYRTELINFLQASRIREAEILASGTFVERVIIKTRPSNVEEMLRGYYLERKLISEYEKRKDITPRYANKLRENVNALETYSLKERINTLSYDLINYRRKV